MKKMKRFNKMLCLTISSIMMLSMVACGSGTSSANSSDSSTQSGASDTAQTGSGKKLIVYTNSNSDGRGEWWQEQASKAGFSIEIVGAGGADLTNRLIAEKSNPTADVVFGLNNMLYEQLKENDVLTKYEPSWASETEAGSNDKDGYYHSLVKQALLMVYNDADFDASSAPKGYEDLWNNEKFAGKYDAQTQVTQMTPRIIIASILTRYKDDAGEYGISEEGWNVISEYFANGVAAVEGEELFSNMANGKVSIGTAVSGTMKSKEEQYDVSVGIVKPEIGTPMIIEQVALINGTKNEATAKEFIDWCGSAEVQTAFAKEFNSMPTNTTAAKEANADIVELFTGLKSQDLDWTFIYENMDLWIEKIQLEIL